MKPKYSYDSLSPRNGEFKTDFSRFPGMRYRGDGHNTPGIRFYESGMVTHSPDIIIGSPDNRRRIAHALGVQVVIISEVSGTLSTPDGRKVAKGHLACRGLIIDGDVALSIGGKIPDSLSQMRGVRAPHKNYIVWPSPTALPYSHSQIVMGRPDKARIKQANAHLEAQSAPLVAVATMDGEESGRPYHGLAFDDVLGACLRGEAIALTYSRVVFHILHSPTYRAQWNSALLEKCREVEAVSWLRWEE